MKRNRQRPDASETRNVGQLSVEFSGEAQRKIRRHARSSMHAEICGVLLGTMKPGCTVVDEIISGESALEAGTHVTFTQATWAHIYEVKDSKHPDQRIVGWYHSHPGFGIFLSDHDLFIHKNFFSDPNQIAWVFDPRSDEEGCFVWKGGGVVRLESLAVKTVQSECECAIEGEPADDPIAADDQSEPEQLSRRGGSFRSRWIRWCVLVASHLAILLAGVLVGLLAGTEVVFVARPEPASPVLKTSPARSAPDASLPPKERRP
jgi:proteasome lid subunit RPN8/RPN11